MQLVSVKYDFISWGAEKGPLKRECPWMRTYRPQFFLFQHFTRRDANRITANEFTSQECADYNMPESPRSVLDSYSLKFERGHIQLFHNSRFLLAVLYFSLPWNGTHITEPFGRAYGSHPYGRTSTSESWPAIRGKNSAEIHEN